MSTTAVSAPTSSLRVGHARADITPPVGIYHRMWGAARHDRATGVHRPLVADVLVLAPLEPAPPEPAPPESAPPESPEHHGRLLVRAHLDLVGLPQARHQALRRALAAGAGVPLEDATVAYSHSHSAGWLLPDRSAFPGGELIAPYLDDLATRLGDAARRAAGALRPATVTYARGRCAMGANRDYWDAGRRHFVCGTNPDAVADDTVIAARVAGPRGETVATLVNYACHPTTLAWENTLLSPDYPGAMRETVERATGAPCVFVLGACGDIGPRYGFTGDPLAADQNGHELGYAALAALAGLRPPATDLRYAGPVLSGATLGVWQDAPFSASRQAQAARFEGGLYTVDLPLKPLPDPDALRAELTAWEQRQGEADARGDSGAARDHGARAERARRWIARLEDLPPGPTYAMPYAVHRFGDAVWVACGGEPYSALQAELRRRFPTTAIVVSTLSGALQVAYLLTAERYGLGLYQEEPSILGPGCLEALTGAIAGRIGALSLPDPGPP
ncbi:MAG TPA: hypothetical protein VHQ00_03740 [Chloroflexota bacterium]|nr:hypothetical protein [Chloroflexota bacterium]